MKIYIGKTFKKYRIETQKDNKWHPMLSGTSDDKDKTIGVATRVFASFEENRNNPKHACYNRTGVRVTDGDEIFWEKIL